MTRRPGWPTCCAGSTITWLPVSMKSCPRTGKLALPDWRRSSCHNGSVTLSHHRAPRRFQMRCAAAALLLLTVTGCVTGPRMPPSAPDSFLLALADLLKHGDLSDVSFTAQSLGTEFSPNRKPKGGGCDQRGVMTAVQTDRNVPDREFWYLARNRSAKEPFYYDISYAQTCAFRNHPCSLTSTLIFNETYKVFCITPAQLISAFPRIAVWRVSDSLTYSVYETGRDRSPLNLDFNFGASETPPMSGCVLSVMLRQTGYAKDRPRQFE